MEKLSVENTTKPLVTVAIPTYNGGESVRKALTSVLAQEYTNLEILIADNGSAMETQTVCQELAATYAQVKYFRHPQNIGMLANFEFLLKQTNGKYFMWLADDDTLAGKVLYRYVDFMEANPSYSVVSGIIEYWLNGKVKELEQGLSFQQRWAMLRVIGYYFKVVHGAMYHGLLRTQLAQQVELRKVIASDWHFVATLAFLGRIKNFEFIGYRKSFGGTSRSFEQYAALIGESSFAGRYPHLKISIDTWKEIVKSSSIYAKASVIYRTVLGLSSSLAVLLSYSIKIYPFIIGGKVKRFLKRTLTLKKVTYAKNRM